MKKIVIQQLNPIDTSLEFELNTETDIAYHNPTVSRLQPHQVILLCDKYPNSIKINDKGQIEVNDFTHFLISNKLKSYEASAHPPPLTLPPSISSVSLFTPRPKSSPPASMGQVENELPDSSNELKRAHSDPASIKQNLELNNLVRLKESASGIWSDTLAYEEYFLNKNIEEQKKKQVTSILSPINLSLDHSLQSNKNLYPIRQQQIVLIRILFDFILNPIYEKYLMGTEQYSKIAKYFLQAIHGIMKIDRFIWEPASFEQLSDAEKLEKFNNKVLYEHAVENRLKSNAETLLFPLSFLLSEEPSAVTDDLQLKLHLEMLKNYLGEEINASNEVQFYLEKMIAQAKIQNPAPNNSFVTMLNKLSQLFDDKQKSINFIIKNLKHLIINSAKIIRRQEAAAHSLQSAIKSHARESYSYSQITHNNEIQHIEFYSFYNLIKKHIQDSGKIAQKDNFCEMVVMEAITLIKTKYNIDINNKAHIALLDKEDFFICIVWTNALETKLVKIFDEFNKPNKEKHKLTNSLKFNHTESPLKKLSKEICTALDTIITEGLYQLQHKDLKFSYSTML